MAFRREGYRAARLSSTYPYHTRQLTPTSSSSSPSSSLYHNTNNNNNNHHNHNNHLINNHISNLSHNSIHSHSHSHSPPLSPSPPPFPLSSSSSSVYHSNNNHNHHSNHHPNNNPHPHPHLVHSSRNYHSNHHISNNNNNIHNHHNDHNIHNHNHPPNYHSNNYLSNHNPSYSSSSSSHQRYIRPTEPDGPINEYGIYCGNLAWDVTSDMLKEFLSQIGTVVSCELFLNYDGRSKGSALAKFETKESATRAILELNDTDFKGRLIQVRPDREKPKRDDDRPPVSMPLSERQIPPGVDSRRVYVGNLGWGVAWQDLKDHMRQAGDVIRAEIMQGPGGRSKGCGIVEYSSADEARHAIAVLHDTELQGRLILVRQDKDDGRHSVPHLPHYSSMLSPLSPYMGNLGSPTHSHPHSHPHPHPHSHQHQHPPPPHPHSPYSERWNHHHHHQPPPPPPPQYMMNHQPPYMMNHQQQSLYSTPSGVPIPPLSSPRLYIGNLVYEVSWQELKDHMRVAGEVVRIDLKMSPDGSRNKGCGIIEYRDIQSAQRALAMLSDSLLRGRPIFLREDREERKMMTDRRM